MKLSKTKLNFFAKITGESAKGEALVKSMEDKIASVQAKLPRDKKQVAILHSTAKNVTVQLDGSIAGSVAKMLGFENVASGSLPLEKDPDSTPYSLETLVKQSPQIIFVTSMGEMEVIKKACWIMWKITRLGIP